MMFQTLKKFVTERGASLDLGAGNLRDSKFLLSHGFARVVAVDISEESLAFATEGIDLRIAPIETFVPDSNAFDFAFCCNCLFFLPPEHTANVFKNVLTGLRPGGVFTCNVLGEEDDWIVRRRNAVCFTKESLLALTPGFKVLKMSEEKNRRDILHVSGSVEKSKLCHDIRIVVQKP